MPAAFLAPRRIWRLLICGRLARPQALVGFSARLAGLLSCSTVDNVVPSPAIEGLTKRQPDIARIDDMAVGFTSQKHVKSNTIVYAKDGATVEFGAAR